MISLGRGCILSRKSSGSLTGMAQRDLRFGREDHFHRGFAGGGDARAHRGVRRIERAGGAGVAEHADGPGADGVGGSLANFMVTHEEVMRRAKEVLNALREGG